MLERDYKSPKIITENYVYLGAVLYEESKVSRSGKLAIIEFEVMDIGQSDLYFIEMNEHTFFADYHDVIIELDEVNNGFFSNIECDEYTDSISCEDDDNCDWCPECDGRKVNTWGEDRCVGAGTCAYRCDADNCQAECDVNNPCGPEASGGTCYYSGECESDCTCSYDEECSLGQCCDCTDEGCVPNDDNCPGGKPCKANCQCGTCSFDTDCPAQDTDTGDKPFIGGTCTEKYCDAGDCIDSSSHPDSCSDNMLTEYYRDPGNINLCTNKEYNCDDEDCKELASSCTISDSSLDRLGNDYTCTDANPDYCDKVEPKTCDSYPCPDNEGQECFSLTCVGTAYYCFYSNSESHTWDTEYPETETACDDGHDNDCDGKCDADGCNGMSADPDCGKCEPCNYRNGEDPDYCQHCDETGNWENIHEDDVCDDYVDESTPATSPFCLDETTSSSKVCDLACESGTCSNKINCVCEYGGDGTGTTRCGAECDGPEDCPCDQENGCVGNDYHDYPDEGECTDNCECDTGTGQDESCEPTITHCSEQDPSTGYCKCSCGDYIDHNGENTVSCNDGIDNDCDGLTDSRDPDCQDVTSTTTTTSPTTTTTTTSTTTTTEEVSEDCDNDEDDDGDGDIDCYDEDCPAPTCPVCQHPVCNEYENYDWTCQPDSEGSNCGDCKQCDDNGNCVPCSEVEETCCYWRMETCMSHDDMGDGFCMDELVSPSLCYVHSEINNDPDSEWNGFQCCWENWIDLEVSDDCNIDVSCDRVDVSPDGGDGSIDIRDVSYVAIRFRLCDKSKYPSEDCDECGTKLCYDTKYDFDGNGKINLIDVIVVANYFGKECEEE